MLIGVLVSEIIFILCATESSNLVIWGVAATKVVLGWVVMLLIEYFVMISLCVELEV